VQPTQNAGEKRTQRSLVCQGELQGARLREQYQLRRPVGLTNGRVAGFVLFKALPANFVHKQKQVGAKQVAEPARVSAIACGCDRVAV
jgi:hypothetical protein